MRRSQRAPRSCIECASRKVKCNKAIPCEPCIGRGVAATCSREAVLVRGVVTRARDERRDDRSRPDQVAQRSISNALLLARPSSEPISAVPTSVNVLLNEPSKLMTLSFPSPFQPSVRSWDDIVLPTKSQSFDLIEHSKVWTAWIHCAICYDDFEPAHENFWAFLASGRSLDQYDHSWLAIYFALLAAALLTQDEDDTDRGLFLDGNLPYFMRMWYSASVFCLESSEFMRNSKYMTVQAISVLQMSANAVGDHVFRIRSLAVGTQIANELGMPFNQSDGYSLIQAECSRRLWWVFVICEWLFPPSHRSLINEHAFDLILPSSLTEEDLLHGSEGRAEGNAKVSPWLYHVVLCEMAVVNYRFNKAVRKGTTDLEFLVKVADQELAKIFENLPWHLAPSGEASYHRLQAEAVPPWIKWQRVDAITNLFLTRAKVNYQYSARSIIIIYESADLPLHQRRHMTYTLRLYHAGLILISELPGMTAQEQASSTEDVTKCIEQLREASPRNSSAEKAAEHLQTLLQDLSAALGMSGPVRE